MSKKQKKFIASLVMVSLVVAIYGYFPSPNNAQAVNALKDAKVLITDSDYSVQATSTFTFVTATSTVVGGYYEVVYPAGFGAITPAQITCPDANYTATVPVAGTARCARTVSTIASGTRTIIIANVTNAATGNGLVFNIAHNDTATNLAERVQVMVALVDDVWMTARVDATLQFTVTGTSTGAVVNGVTCTATTTATSTPFGTLVPGVPSTVCQQLNVTTNASDGFTVTVEQDDEMTSDGGDNINSFNNAADGTGSTTAVAWVNPYGILDDDKTYGHMGLTSNDQDLVTAYANQDYYNGGAAAHYAGLNGVAPIAVYSHDGPADGSTNATQNKGKAMVAYTAEINALQQAGDYENTLTYIATPTY